MPPALLNQAAHIRGTFAISIGNSICKHIVLFIGNVSHFYSFKDQFIKNSLAFLKSYMFSLLF